MVLLLPDIPYIICQELVAGLSQGGGFPRFYHPIPSYQRLDLVRYDCFGLSGGDCLTSYLPFAVYNSKIDRS